jgi:hypothetical protein
MDIVVWLRSLGLGKYEAAFRENEINEKILLSLTAEDLKELGVAALGHRRMLLDAIAVLRGQADGAPTTTPGPAAVDASFRDTAERRQVTVMFSDLVGSTALSARMDPEDLREVINGYQKCVAETVQRFGGFVAKYMGDGVLIYFGYPQAHEDDAERGRCGKCSANPLGPTDTHWHRNGPGCSRRSDWVGCFSGASNRRRDTEPCSPPASVGRTEYGRSRRERATASRQPL